MTTLRVTAPPGGWAPPWPVVIEIASVLPSTSWMLVGGLMVQLHARAAGVEEVRPTHDVDALVDVMAAGVSVVGIAAALTARGFAVVEGRRAEAGNQPPVHPLQALVVRGRAKHYSQSLSTSRSETPQSRCRASHRPGMNMP